MTTTADIQKCNTVGCWGIIIVLYYCNIYTTLQKSERSGCSRKVECAAWRRGWPRVAKSGKRRYHVFLAEVRHRQSALPEHRLVQYQSEDFNRIL